LSMPGWATSLRELSTSNGCQNDTSSPSAALRLSQRLRRAKRRSSACHSSAHGPYDPPCHPLTSPDAAASTASRPALVTTRDRPSCRNETAMDMQLIWVRRKQKYFCKRGWTGHFGKHEVICPSGKISSTCLSCCLHFSDLMGRAGDVDSSAAHRGACARAARGWSTRQTLTCRIAIRRWPAGSRAPHPGWQGQP
jgi:hypothetical protein